MTAIVVDLLLLAVEGGEGIPPEHIASKLAVPLAFLIFSGSVYLLLWSNYGAKKAAAIYGTAFFAFSTMIGIFWWFAAPGGLVAGGLQNFPGQPGDEYQGSWHAFEQGSERAEFFPVANDVSQFQTPEDYVSSQGGLQSFLLGGEDYVSFLGGIMESAAEQMSSLYLPTDESGAVRIGGNRRQSYTQAAGDPQQGESRAQPFFSASPSPVRVADTSEGVKIAASEITVTANFVDEETGQQTRSVQVDSETVFSFRDPGAVWFPSAVWTGVSFLLFLGSLFALDRLEQREKRRQAEVEEPEDLAVPVAQ